MRGWCNLRRVNVISQRTPLGRHIKAEGITVTRLSNVTQIHPRTISDYLAGRRQFNPGHLAKIAEALDVEPDELYYTPEMVDAG